jgi:hypothetical protein
MSMWFRTRIELHSFHAREVASQLSEGEWREGVVSGDINNILFGFYWKICTSLQILYKYRTSSHRIVKIIRQMKTLFHEAKPA